MNRGERWAQAPCLSFQSIYPRIHLTNKRLLSPAGTGHYRGHCLRKQAPQLRANPKASHTGRETGLDRTGVPQPGRCKAEVVVRAPDAPCRVRPQLCPGCLDWPPPALWDPTAAPYQSQKWTSKDKPPLTCEELEPNSAPSPSCTPITHRWTHSNHLSTQPLHTHVHSVHTIMQRYPVIITSPYSPAHSQAQVSHLSSPHSQLPSVTSFLVLIHTLSSDPKMWPKPPGRDFEKAQFGHRFSSPLEAF